MDDTDNTSIELELTSELKQKGIVDSFIFKVQINSVVLSLNHMYNEKKVICPINIHQWIRSTDNLTKRKKREQI